MRRSSPRPSEPPSDASGSYALAGLIFAAGGLVLAWPWLSGTVTIPYDAKAEFYPQFAFLARALHEGQSPFWTPNIFTGSPQIADPQSLIFTPAYLLAALLVRDPGFILADAIVFATLCAGGFALILFFRDRHWHAAGALVAALAFAFGGSAAWRIQHIGQVLSLAWFPVVLLCLSRALLRGSIPWGALAGLCGGFLLLGRDQVALLELYLLSAYAITFLIGRPVRQTLWPLVAGFVAGIAVAAVPLAFTIALADQSNRPEIGFAEALKGSLHPASLLTLFSANLFGVAGPLRDFWGPPTPAWGQTGIFVARNMGTVYMGGLAVLACIALAVTRPTAFWRDRDARFFLCASVALSLYALGQFTPAFTLLYELPGVDLFRRPADATFPLCACLALLGGFAVHRLAQERPHGAVVATIVIAAVLLCGVTAVAKGRFAQALPAITMSAACLAASGVVLLLLPRVSRNAAILIAGSVLTLDLAVGNAPNESTGLPPAQFAMLRIGTDNDTILLLKERLRETAAPDRRDRIELAGIGFDWPNASLVHGFDNSLGYNPLRLALFEAFTGASDHVALPEQRVFSKAFPSYRSPAADLTGLRFIATGVPVEQIDRSLKPGDLTFLARTKDAFIYENPRALPRVLLANRAIRHDQDRLVTTGDWPEADYGATVLLDAPEDPDRPRRPGSAKVLTYGNTHIRAAAEAPDGGWLVLNDIWHPWSTATVDGAPAKILRANGAFRAVALPPGRHTVDFTFEPLTGAVRQLRAAFLAVPNP